MDFCNERDSVGFGVDGREGERVIQKLVHQLADRDQQPFACRRRQAEVDMSAWRSPKLFDLLPRHGRFNSHKLCPRNGLNRGISDNGAHFPGSKIQHEHHKSFDGKNLGSNRMLDMEEHQHRHEKCHQHMQHKEKAIRQSPYRPERGANHHSQQSDRGQASDYITIAKPIPTVGLHEEVEVECRVGGEEDSADSGKNAMPLIEVLV
jgi:hypothetical protein